MRLDVINGFLAGLRPAPRIKVTEWACKYRWLSSKISPEPGLYKVDRTPYLRDIMDDLSPYSPVEEVIFMKSSQVGATQAGNNWIGSIIHISPAPTLMVLPTDALAKRNSKMNIDSMIESTPELRERVPNARERDSGNTTLEKHFPGGFLAITSAGSSNSARSTSFRYIYLDELSAYPVDMDGEGDPYALFVGRSKAFGSKRKIFSGSTPGTEGLCRISSLFEDTDQRKFHVPCPCCGTMQVLEFERLHYVVVGEEVEDVYYECLEGCRIEERHKPKFLAAGEWVPTNPKKISISKKGYHISALYTPLGWYSWGQLAKDFVAAENAENKTEALKSFYNTNLGRTWKETADIPDFQRLMDRAEDYKDGEPVLDVAVLTAGVDVQKNRIEVEVLGWATNKRTYSVDYKVFEGDTDKTDVWYSLRDYLNSEFPRPDGSFMTIAFVCVDSGYLANMVYEFCQKMGAYRCVPVKGGPETLRVIVGQATTVDITRDNKKIGTTMLRMVGQSVIKETIYSRLNLQMDYATGEIPTGYCHFPKDRGYYYFRGLCSEVYREKTKKSGKAGWEKVVERNEPLDLRVYAYVAGYLAGITRKEDQWFLDEIARYVPERREFTQKQSRQRRKSDFL